jgi:hypothetical protein
VAQLEVLPGSTDIAADIDSLGRFYTAGRGIFTGVPSDTDFWFREGIIVPEPSTWMLFYTGAVLLVAAMRRFPSTISGGNVTADRRVISVSTAETG